MTKFKVSKNGINLVKKYEGCKLTAYKCPAGVTTIGYGHTGPIDGKALTMSTKITQAKAEELLIHSLNGSYAQSVNNLKNIKNQNEFDALVSFAYNLGAGIFKGNLLAAINSGNKQEVARQMRLYNKARVNGVLTELPGLTKRRQEEAELFLKEVATPKVDVAHQKNVNTLVSTKIISQPDVWMQCDDKVKSLISKMSLYIENNK